MSVKKLINNLELVTLKSQANTIVWREKVDNLIMQTAEEAGLEMKVALPHTQVGTTVIVQALVTDELTKWLISPHNGCYHT
jgi:hypothetical protein